LAETATGQLTRKELQELRRLKAVKEALDELKRRGFSADIPVCPVCKSPRLVNLTSYYDLGYIGSFQPAFYCIDCGWYGRRVITMSNRPEHEEVLEDMKKAFPAFRDDSSSDEE
jgi:hypothetical protein